MPWTKRERVLAALSGEQPDRVPIFECLINDDVLTHFGGARLAAGDFAGTVRACAQCLDLCHPALVPQAPGTEERDGVRVVRERWTTWTQRTAPLSDLEIVRALETEITAAEAWRPAPDSAGAFRQQVERVDALAGDMVYLHLATGCAVLPFDLAVGSLAWADHPELVRRWNRALNARLLRHFDAIADGRLAPVCIVWNDVGGKSRLLYPPALLAELFYPHLRELADLLHSRGVKLLLHSDGDVTSILPQLIACGMDGFNPLELSAGMTPERFIECCGRRVALVGGIDAVDVLARGTPALVAARSRALIALFRNRGSLILGSASGEIDDSMPLANVLAMYHTAWDEGRY